MWCCQQWQHVCTQVLVQLERQRQLLLQRLHALVTRVADAKSRAAAACAPLTPEEKSSVTRSLAVLPQEHFETALSLVLAHHPDLLPQGTSGETVLNADHMDALTLRQLQSFIAAVHAAEQQLGAVGQRPAGEAVQWPGLVLGSGAHGVCTVWATHCVDVHRQETAATAT